MGSVGVPEVGAAVLVREAEHDLLHQVRLLEELAVQGVQVLQPPLLRVCGAAWLTGRRLTRRPMQIIAREHTNEQVNK